MLELIAVFSSGAIEDEQTVRGVLERVVAMPGTELTRYDLNQMEHWRNFDLDRAVIDTLTQRTQMFRAEGLGLLYFALGKHGEPPTVILRAAAEIDAVDTASWFALPRLVELRASTSAWTAQHPNTPQLHKTRT